MPHWGVFAGGRRIKFNRLIVLFISIGLFVLSFEIFLEHYYGLSENKKMFIPIFYGAIGGICGMYSAITFKAKSYYLFLSNMICSLMVGILGLYFHNAWRYLSISSALANKESIDLEIFTTYTPLLAPSAFCAIGGLGLLTAFYQPWVEQKKKKK